MKYEDPITGELKDITIKAGDTLPVGAIIEFDGDIIPAGYEEVTDEVDQKEVFVGPDEPTTGEEVWIDDINKKIYTKNDNGVYQEFYNETNREVYSTAEQRIGTWIDGKPIYRKTILQNTFTAGESEINHNISDVERIVNISGIAYRTDGSAEPLPTLCPPEYIELWQLSVYDVNRTRYRIYVGSNLITDYARLGELYLTLEYTKTTD